MKSKFGNRCRAEHRLLGIRLGLTRLEDRMVPAFAAPVAYPVAVGPHCMVSADFNNDGQPDLATASAGALSILLGNTGGTLQRMPDISPATNVYGLTSADFDNDGNMDLVTSPDQGPASFLSRGNGDGTFQAPSSFPIFAAGGETIVASADMNSDGNADLLAVGWWDYYMEQHLQVLLGDGHGAFTTAYNTGLWYGGWEERSIARFEPETSMRTAEPMC